jgi:hypothetical protein
LGNEVSVSGAANVPSPLPQKKATSKMLLMPVFMNHDVHQEV